MSLIPYASIISCLMYALVCTCPKIAFVTSVLGKCLSDPSKKTLDYC